MSYSPVPLIYILHLKGRTKLCVRPCVSVTQPFWVRPYSGPMCTRHQAAEGRADSESLQKGRDCCAANTEKSEADLAVSGTGLSPFATKIKT